MQSHNSFVKQRLHITKRLVNLNRTELLTKFLVFSAAFQCPKFSQLHNHTIAYSGLTPCRTAQIAIFFCQRLTCSSLPLSSRSPGLLLESSVAGSVLIDRSLNMLPLLKVRVASRLCCQSAQLVAADCHQLEKYYQSSRRTVSVHQRVRQTILQRGCFPVRIQPPRPKLHSLH